jgi:hypothetical protein
MKTKSLMGVRVLRGVICMGALLGVLVSAASAGAVGPWWQISSGSTPASLPQSGEGKIVLAVTNFGDGRVEGAGSPVTVSDRLPAGLTAKAISGTSGPLTSFSEFGEVNCTVATVSCTYEGSLPAYERLWVTITVEVTGAAVSGAPNEASVVGGGAPNASVRRPVRIGGASVFGVEDYELTPEEEGGARATQAGSHPFQVTSTIALNQSAEKPFQPSLPKDLHFRLPAGLVGNPTPFLQCSDAAFSHLVQFSFNECPADTAIGVAIVTIDEPGDIGLVTLPVPLFNLQPTRGEPARFGFNVLGNPVLLDTSVRTGGDYGVDVDVDNITELPAFLAARVTFWGTPGDPRHDASRGWNCLTGSGTCSPLGEAKPPPFLTLPTSCASPSFETSATADSWAHPGAFTTPTVYSLLDGLGEPVGIDGCNRLPFEPSISVAPDGQNASTPTGLSVALKVPQEAILTANGLAQSDVKDTTVTLPEGVQLSPAAADGLLSCSLGQIALEEDGSPSCPEASKVGTVEIKSPLLPEPLEGAAYLAAQTANPFGSLVALYIVAEDPVAGVVVKFAGKVSPDPVTGQLVSTFENTPPLPFSELKLHFFGSARAPLTTPALCGSYTTRAVIAPSSGDAPAEPTSTFNITAGPNGSPCADPRPFDPGFQAGTTSIQAGGYTPLTLTMSRPDADQTLAGLSVQFPPGLVGSLSKVTLCPEPQASTGECPEGSLIGHTVVSAGLGNSPFTVEGGKVFITGPYKGAPFGLSILNPAKAGPFNLGYVVVRAKIEVDPTTAALHIVSDPLPTIKDGIPLQIQHVNVTVDKPEFTFNPTDCNAMKLTGTMTSTEGASASVETPFQVTNCASLAFKPAFSVSTSSKTSRVDGASLAVKLTFPSAPAGTQANIAKVKVELPKQLPSRLTTLQKACTEAVFDTNPEGCPAASRVGAAVATTPILAGGLSGPAYFVSHGGAKFPELIVVLKGENGVTVDLHGETYISKTGITSSTFNTVPDVPVGSFELKLPEGPYSALAALGNLCKQKLAMPTEFAAQNGATIHQSTKITVTGCPKSTHVKRKKESKKHKTHGKKKKKR